MSQGHELPPFSPQQRAALKKEWEDTNRRRAERARQEGSEDIGRIVAGDQITANFFVPGNKERGIPGRNENVTAIYHGRKNDGSFIFTPLPRPEAPQAPAAQPLPPPAGDFGPNNNQQFGPMGSDSWPESQYSHMPGQSPQPRVEEEHVGYSVFNGPPPDEETDIELPNEQSSAVTPDERDPEATDVYPIDTQGPAADEKPAEEVVAPVKKPEAYIPQGGFATQSVIGEETKQDGPAPEGPQRWSGHDRPTIREDDEIHRQIRNNMPTIWGSGS